MPVERAGPARRRGHHGLRRKDRRRRLRGRNGQGPNGRARRERALSPALPRASPACMRAKPRTSRPTFPAEYPATPNWPGKPPSSRSTVHDVKALELPAIDDAFAQTQSRKMRRSKQLRADVRKRLEAIAESRARRTTGNAVMEKLVEAHDFPLPEVMVEREIDNMINDIAQQVCARRRQLRRVPSRAREDGGALRDDIPRRRAGARQGHPFDRGDRAARRASTQRRPTSPRNLRRSRASTVSRSTEFVRRWETTSFR